MTQHSFLTALLLGWLPIGAILATMMFATHGGPLSDAAFVATRMIFAAALLGLLIGRVAARWPWPHPFRAAFLARHAAAALIYSATWFVLNCALESVVRGQIVVVLGPGLAGYLALGIWIYVMVAGITYAARATSRSAELEAVNAQAQLAALRAQLHPHFLFNALHTVVQLIPVDPAAASRAAEQLGSALRTAIDEQRDTITLGEELDFVQRYLAIEALRFGPRLHVEVDADERARASDVPSFAVQTLVENAVRHGAAPALEPTVLRIRATRATDALTVDVSDTGVGATASRFAQSTGGLRRLRERLAALYGDAARLAVEPLHDRGVRATLTVPQLDA